MDPWKIQQRKPSGGSTPPGPGHLPLWLTQPWGVGVAIGLRRSGEQRSHLSLQGGTELVFQKSSQRADIAILLSP